MGTIAYQPLTTAEQIFKSLIWDPMIKAGETWLEVEVPFLAVPVVKQLDEATLNALTDALFNQLVLFVDVTAIKLVNQAHQTAYDNASEALAVIADEQGVNSDAFKTAQTQALAALATFTHMGP